MYNINEEKINMVLFFFKLFFINIGTYYIFLKFADIKSSIKNNIKGMLVIAVISIVCLLVRESSDNLNCRIFQIVLLILSLNTVNPIGIGDSIINTILALSISNIIFFISVIINAAPNRIFDIENDYISFIFILIIYCIIIYGFLRIKRLKNGFSFLKRNDQKDFFDILMLYISTIVLFMIEIFGKYHQNTWGKIGLGIIILSIMMILIIKKSFQVYYKQKLMIKQLEETEEEVKEKEEEIKKLEQENLSFSKRSHSLAHKQKALEYKLNQLLMNEETANELGIQKEVKDLSKELYQKPVEELTKTGIRQIDDMLEFMQAECTKNNIDFNFQIMGNVYYIINNIISVEKLEILLADHIKDAIIAIKHTDNINRSILVRLGKIEECYGLYIYDSGIEFEKETLQNLGKKPSTTHEDEGGTGMGFMNTFDTLRECKGSLIINEISKPSKDNFTKVIMIKFDNKNEFNVISYKN